MAEHDFGSLTKEPPLSELDKTILAIRPGMAYAELLEFAKANTHHTAPGLIRKRFIHVGQDGRIIYEHFLSLVSTHGVASPIVRKVMFFTWAYRDERLRRFICERIADEHGKWRIGELLNIGSARFFEIEKWLAPTTARKARSNIQFFLEETGILDASKRAVHLELADGWLGEAAVVAAQYERDPRKRHLLLSNVSQFLAVNRWTALANADGTELEELRLFPPDATALDDSSIALQSRRSLATKEWKRQAPTSSDRVSTNAYLDLVYRERANQSHFQLEKLAADAIMSKKYSPRFNEQIDMFFESPRGTAMFEMKSCDWGNMHSQIRKGVSQLFEYRYVYREMLGDHPTLVLAIETAPPSEKAWLAGHLQSLDILLVWKDAATKRLVTTCSIPQILEGIVHQQSTWFDEYP